MLRAEAIAEGPAAAPEAAGEGEGEGDSPDMRRGPAASSESPEA